MPLFCRPLRCPSLATALATALVLVVGASTGAATTATAQSTPVADSSARSLPMRLADAGASPEATAAAFLRSLRALRPDLTARLIDHATLERFATTVHQMVRPDTSGYVARYLLGVAARDAAALTDTDVFARSVAALLADMPGLANAVNDRDDEVLGSVPEGSDRAHVVYRTTARISGAVPEVLVLQTVRTDSGWRVAWSDELDVLDTALRGVARRPR